MSERINSRTAMRLRFIVGTNDETGKSIFQARSFNNVKETAADEDVLEVAIGMGSLVDKPIGHVERVHQVEIIQA